MGKNKVIFGYCKYCKKEVDHPIKRPFDSMQWTVWIIIIISTLGFALIVLIIYKKYIMKAKYCPDCLSTLKLSEEPHDKKTIEIPKEDLTPKEEILEKVEILEETPYDLEPADPTKMFCPFCGEKIKKDIATCPYCQTVINY